MHDLCSRCKTILMVMMMIIIIMFKLLYTKKSNYTIQGGLIFFHKRINLNILIKLTKY